MTEQTLVTLRARNRAFRWPKGVSGNPDGQSRFYHEARRVAREASPEMMRELVELAKNAEDERVRAVSLVAVLDRAGLKPIDFDPSEDRADKPKFDPRLYSAEELGLIERALRMMLAPRQALAAAEAQDAGGKDSFCHRREARTGAIEARGGYQPPQLPEVRPLPESEPPP